MCSTSKKPRLHYVGSSHFVCQPLDTLSSSPLLLSIHFLCTFPFLSFLLLNPPLLSSLYLPSAHFLRTYLGPFNFRHRRMVDEIAQLTDKNRICCLTWNSRNWPWYLTEILFFVRKRNGFCLGRTFPGRHSCVGPPVSHFTNTLAPPQNDSSMSKWLPENLAKEEKKKNQKLVIYPQNAELNRFWMTPIHQGMCCFANSVIITSIGTM